MSEGKKKKNKHAAHLSLKIPKKAHIKLIHPALKPPIPEEARDDDVGEQHAAGSAELGLEVAEHGDAEILAALSGDGGGCGCGCDAVEVVFDAGADLQEELGVVGDDAVDEDGQWRCW